MPLANAPTVSMRRAWCRLLSKRARSCSRCPRSMAFTTASRAMRNKPSSIDSMMLPRRSASKPRTAPTPPLPMFETHAQPHRSVAARTSLSEPCQQRWRSFRPAGRECHPLRAPRIYLDRLTRHHEIRAVRVNKMRQFGQTPFDLSVNLSRPGVDETRRHTCDHVLVCGVALQRQSARSELQPELHKETEQKQ